MTIKQMTTGINITYFNEHFTPKPIQKHQSIHIIKLIMEIIISNTHIYTAIMW